MLGKRKRDLAVASRRTGSSDATLPESNGLAHSDQDFFRKYFESKFTPLPTTTTIPLQESGYDEKDDIEEDESDWEGLSDAEPNPSNVQIVEYHTLQDSELEQPSTPSLTKTFMSSKPPREIKNLAPTRHQEVQAEDESETLNLKHDLDLQRLLKESHLLEQSNMSLGPGANRHKVTDLRMQSLGSKASIFTQEKMPISHRKGITAKAVMKEQKRRREALENGIVLEKSTKASKQSSSRRQRTVDVPVVGKFRGGMLTLSRKDVSEIQGPRTNKGRKSARRGRG